MAEEKTVSAPRRLLDSALKAVKGDSTQQLVESFTAEMTLVAEGLSEDQGRLRKSLEDLTDENDRARQRLKSDIDALETTQAEDRAHMDQRLEELTRRVAALEAHEKAFREKKTLLPNGVLRQVILLASIVCGSWVLVTILQLLK